MTAAEPTVGATAPDLTRTITQRDMVAYAGATWDWHRMHYDPQFCAANGFPAPVVDGQVFGALLAEQLQDWLGPRALLRSLHLRFQALVFAGESVRCVSRVTAVEPDQPGGTGARLVSFQCRVEVLDPDGSVNRVAVAPAGATVAVRR